MVTATTVDSKPVVNISAVFENTYTSNEKMVTLSFTVKRDYTDMSTCLTPSVREVTDANLKDVTVNWVYDPNAGLTTDSSQNLVPDDTTNSGTSSGTTGGTTGTTTGGTTSGTTSGTTGSDTTGSDTTGNGTTVSSGSSGLTTTTTPNGTVKKTTTSSVDNTPSTGAVDLTLVLGIVIAVFVGISGVCLYVLKKKNVA
jgi:cobalamin biosynthesis Mg chelatase CobN